MIKHQLLIGTTFQFCIDNMNITDSEAQSSHLVMAAKLSVAGREYLLMFCFLVLLVWTIEVTLVPF